MLDPSFKAKRGQPNLKVLITCLLLTLEVCNVKPSYRMRWKSFDMVKFDLGPLLQGVQPILKVLITRLLLILEVCNVKTTCRISWAGNFLMLSDLTFGPSFQLKQWFTGFGELSFRWIQICIGSPMRRSSLNMNVKGDFVVSHSVC